MSSKVTDQAISDYHSGTPVKEVLHKYSVSRTQFYRRLKQCSVEKRGQAHIYSQEQLTQIALEYQSGKTIAELVAVHGGCLKTLSEYLKSIQCHIRTPSEYTQVYTDAQIQQCIDNYLNGLSARLSGEWCEASEPSVFRWLQERQIDRRHQPDYGGIKDYFTDLDTEHKLYWFGFLCADGNLSAKKYIRILLSQKDADHLRWFQQDIQYSKPIALFSKNRQWKDRSPKTYHYALATIGCRQMVKDLIRHGMKEIKHGNPSKLYKMDDGSFRYFLRGYFDGDGSLGYYSENWQIMICGPEKQILEYMFSRCPVVKQWCSIKHGDIWRVAYGGNQQVPKICQWLYEGATIYLPRKKARADLAIESTGA